MPKPAKPTARTAYVCSECGEDHGKWQGQCASCGAWDTLQEFVVGANPVFVTNLSF